MVTVLIKLGLSLWSFQLSGKKMMQQMVLALLLLPAVFYFGLLARALHRYTFCVQHSFFGHGNNFLYLLSFLFFFYGGAFLRYQLLNSYPQIRALLTDKPRGVDFEEFWGPRSSPGERAHLQLGRQESLNALWFLSTSSTS